MTGMIRTLFSNVICRKSFSFRISKMSLTTNPGQNGMANNTIAICQMRSTNDKMHNRTQVESIVKLAKDNNSKVSIIVHR